MWSKRKLGPKVMTNRLIFLLFFVSNLGVNLLLAESETRGTLVPVITSPQKLDVRFGEMFQYTIRASNSPSGFSIQEAPFWVEREGNQIKGQALSLGTFRLKLNAVNLNGSSPTHTLVINVVPAEREQNEAPNHEIF